MQALGRPGLRRQDRTLEHLLLHYTQALITQMAQTAVCYRHHSISQQLCRWLLQSLDRLSSDELTITQEMIAGMLGVRREGVTEAARKLQKAGFIDYHRGHITVLDRQGLETQVCECYRVVKKEFDRLLPSSSHSSLATPIRTHTNSASPKAKVSPLLLRGTG